MGRVEYAAFELQRLACSICLGDADEASRDVGLRYAALSARLPPAALRAVAEFENRLIIWLPCGHSFHYDCLATWSRRCRDFLSGTLCRAEVRESYAAAGDVLAVTNTRSSVRRMSAPTTPRAIATPLHPNFTEQQPSLLWESEDLLGL